MKAYHNLQDVIQTLNHTHKELIAHIKKDKNFGLEAACRLSAVTDDILASIFQKHIPRDLSLHNIAILAIGGYGRGVLAPFSDIDLLFLTDTPSQSLNDALQNCLYDLWDIKFTVGYSIHSLAEVVEKIKNDSDFCTALLEKRLLFGSEALSGQLFKAYSLYQSQTSISFLSLKMKEREVRHKRFGDSRYLVEPDIKNGKGGLRDLQALYWIGKYIYHIPKVEDFTEVSIFSASDLSRIFEAEKFLWSVRFLLHHHAKRGHDKLNFDIQKIIAEDLGYSDDAYRLAVEYFMKDYFITARDIGHITRIFCHALEVQHRMVSRKIKSYFKDILTSYKLGEKAFRISDDRIDFVDEKLVISNPLLMIELFYIADKNHLRYHPNALKTINAHIDLINEDFRADDAPYMLFREILCRAKTPEKTLRDMNEAGILGALIPDFGRIVALMQFNMYHHFTIDEHLIHTVGIMQDIARGKYKKEHPLSTELTQNFDRSSLDILFLAVFLHDMAKGRDEDHSSAGADIARYLAPKMGFSKAETDLLVWLVLHHLAMSEISQKRDLSDINVLQDFAKFVQTSQRLKLLLCLTVADIRAVGPNIWNGWKGELLRTLYRGALDILQAGALQDHRDERVLAYKKMINHATDRKYEAHFDEFSYQFWLGTDQQSCMRLLSAYHQGYTENKDFWVEWYPDRFCDVTEAVIFARDWPGLFSAIAGAMSASGVHIYDARIFTSKRGLAIDQFRIQDISGKAITDKLYLKRIADNLEKAIISHKTDFEAQDYSYHIASERAASFDIPTLVDFDNKASPTHTIIEIETLNRSFLLYDIAAQLSQMGISITSA
ncbi:MAG: [protein-PII] uridylyltransferase, partial [Pseudomonadota bacterium]